jgi:CDP-diacylglycerol--glycerol-3-phosphate 3-phosphatidyltransferase/cardiolipin synthase
MVSLGALILGGAFPAFGMVALGALPAVGIIKLIGLATLWAAAGLTLITGWDYLRVGLRHMD